MDIPNSEKPLHDMQAYQVGEERQQWIFSAVLSTLFLLGGFIIFISIYNEQLKPGLDRGIIIGLNATSLALLLACAYFFAFRYFEDLFYLFIAIGWLANAAYLPFEFLFDSKCSSGSNFVILDCVNFALYTYALSFVSSAAFYLSTLTKPRNTSSYSIWTILGGWGISIIAFTAGGYLLINYVWPGSDPALKFTVYTMPGVAFSSYGLFRVGQQIAGVVKLPQMRNDRTLNILSFSFYSYGVLQLTYPFKIYFLRADVGWIFLGFFILAFAIKITNVYCLVKVLLQVKYPEFVQARSKVVALQERLNRQSQLAALGAISASIEHDMKTPLSGISTKLEAMRLRYPDAKINWYLDKLELDKNRIAAIAKVVPFMRGAEDFYDRDRFMGKVSINELINLAIKAVKVEMSLDTEKFFFRINPDVKPEVRNIEHSVRAYTPMLEQMVVNLFKNGIEAIRDAGKDRGVITIRINVTRDIPEKVGAGQDLRQKYARWVRVEIEDNGCGIPKGNISKLTTLFTTKNDRKPNGGIGLFIARRLLKIHEGVMDIESVENKGTTISIYLPEWEAYQTYVLEHPEGVNRDDVFDEDLEALDDPLDEKQGRPANSESLPEAK